MLYFVILTKECNLLCSYCGGGSDTPPKEIRYSIADLRSFVSKDKDPAIEFYGGEPLLRIGLMKEIMDKVHARYLVQTNGLLMDRIDPALLPRFSTVLVSIDGAKDVTDGERGAGVYDRVLRNSALVRQRGFNGDLVARMTVVQGSDIEKNVRHQGDTGLFDHVHWQLSFSMFWRSDEAEAGLEEWLEEYNAGVTRLVRWWASEMERTGRVVGIVPFVGVMRTLLDGSRSALRCGSGFDSFTVMPDGRVSACPVSVDFAFSISGSYSQDSPGCVPPESVGEPGGSCGEYGVCGG